MAVTFDGGVILGADSRTSTGIYPPEYLPTKIYAWSDSKTINNNLNYDTNKKIQVHTWPIE